MNKMILKSISALIFAFNLFIANLQSVAQTVSIENCREICCNSLILTKPVYSFDGKSLVLTGENNHGLYVLDIQQQQLRCLDKTIKIKSKPVWLKSGEIIYLKGKDFEFVESFKSAENIPTDTVLFIHTRNQKIEAVSLSDNSNWEITPEKALYYNPVISPNRKLAIVHLKSEMYLYATDGSGLIKHLGTGMASSWSPDGSYIFYFLDESTDGHSISNSELYVISANGNFKQKITETNEFYEMWPAISPDGKHVAFADEKSGKIFIADLIISAE